MPILLALSAIYFYPRPPCGGRPFSATMSASLSIEFLSTPSVRRATIYPASCPRARPNFYPRPPCGGRQVGIPNANTDKKISIHALRAEGDALVSPT